MLNLVLSLSINLICFLFMDWIVLEFQKEINFKQEHEFKQSYRCLIDLIPNSQG